MRPGDYARVVAIIGSAHEPPRGSKWGLFGSFTDDDPIRELLTDELVIVVQAVKSRAGLEWYLVLTQEGVGWVYSHALAFVSRSREKASAECYDGHEKKNA